jgi:hypothetical protein
MKRDVTRTGHRTRKGAWDDAVAGARRYFVNNFRDSARQRGVDLLLGKVDAHGNKTRVLLHSIKDRKSGTSFFNLRGGANVTINSDKTSSFDDGLDAILQEILRDVEGATKNDDNDTPVSDLYLKSIPYLKKGRFLQKMSSVVERLFNLMIVTLLTKKMFIYLMILYVLSLIVRVNV